MATHHITVFRADTLLQRLGGLLAMPPLRPGEALHLAPCASVHTCFMRCAIDIAFIDRSGRILKTVRRLAPWRAALCWRAQSTIELTAGALQLRGMRVGDVVTLDMVRGGQS